MTGTDIPPDERAWLNEQISYYRARAHEYDASSTPPPEHDRTRQGLKLLEALRRFRPTGDALEIACGTGQWTVELVRHAVATITAVDSSPEMIELARSKSANDSRVSFVQADIFSWDPSPRYDVVFFGNFLSHVPPGSFDSFWAIVEQALAPQGRVFFVDERADVWRRLRWSAPELPLEDRPLSDGRIFRAVKVYWDPHELETRLRSLGWDISVTATGDAFYWGQGSRRDPRNSGVASEGNPERIQTDEFVIRPTTAADLRLLVTWHSDPDVNRYWDRRPLTDAEVNHKYLGGRLPEVRCFIIESPAGQPVGFIQHADLDTQGDVGIDMFLVSRARGAGLGPRVARHLAKHLVQTASAQRISVDPLVSNQRAVTAWRKAGFVEHSAIESGDHGEPAILMVFQST
jgi:demethylmenaquinone methyltransferase/2-methoxy-6-polyprenyl-1,4-benzoquinol methylase